MCYSFKTSFDCYCTVPQSVEQKEKYGLKYTLKSEVVSKKKLPVVTEV